MPSMRTVLRPNLAVVLVAVAVVDPLKVRPATEAPDRIVSLSPREVQLMSSKLSMGTPMW